MFVLIRYFIYGFILFSGIWIVVDMPFYIEENEPIWGYALTIKWGVIGGFSFLVAYGSGWCLNAIIFGRHIKNAK